MLCMALCVLSKTAYGGEAVGDGFSCSGRHQVTVADVLTSRRTTNEYQIALLNLESSEANKEITENYYKPIFSIGSRVGKNQEDEFRSGDTVTEQYGFERQEQQIAAEAMQRLPGGGVVTLSLNQVWGRDRSESDSDGVTRNVGAQRYYQLEAKQPLLRGAGASASTELETGRLSLQMARLSHQVFLQEDLLKAISLYTELLSSQQNLLRAQRSSQASMDFLLATKAQVEQGVLSASEIDQAEYAVSQSRLELASAEKDKMDAGDRLFMFSGIRLPPSRTLVDLSGIEVPASVLESKFPQATPEIEMAELNVKISRLDKVSAASANEADLDLVMTHGRGWEDRTNKDDAGNITGSGRRSQYYVGLELKKKLNDYPARTALRKAALSVDQRLLALDDIKLRTQLQQTSVKRDFESAQQNLLLLKKKIAIARKNFENERFKIQAGRSTAFLVYAARNNLEQAEGEYIDASSGYVLAAAKLYKELNRLPEFVSNISVIRCPVAG